MELCQVNKLYRLSSPILDFVLYLARLVCVKIMYMYLVLLPPLLTRCCEVPVPTLLDGWMLEDLLHFPSALAQWVNLELKRTL